MRQRDLSGHSVLRYVLALAMSTAASLLPPPAAAVESTAPCLYLDGRQWGTAAGAVIPVAGDFTVELWVYLPRDLARYQEFVSQGAQPAPFYLGVAPDETIRAGDRWIDTGRKLQIGRWTHLAVTHSLSGQGRLYMDGVLASSTDGYVVDQTGSSTRIGAQFGDNSPERSTACIAGVRAWSTVRTPEQVQAGMSVASVSDVSHLLFEIPPRADLSGNLLPARGENGAIEFTFAQALAYGSWSVPVPSNARQPLSVFPVCTDQQQAACVESLVAVADDGQRRVAKLTGRSAPSSGSFASEEILGTVPEWTIPETVNEDGRSEFAVEAFYFPLGNEYCWGPLVTDCARDVDEIVMTVWPSPLGPALPSVDIPNGPDEICGTVTSPVTCSRPWKLNADVRYEVSLRLPTGFEPSLSHMAAQQGGIEYTDLGGGRTRVTLTARPTEQTLVYDTQIRPATGQSAERADANTNLITLYLASVRQGHNSWLAACGGGKGVMIWRNGVIMSWPTWSKSDQAVTMQVRSAHLDPRGSAVKGFLQIAVPVTLAKCLWGVDLTKTAVGTVAVVYDGQGASDAAVTSTRVDNTTYMITSTGFHYSTATIQVKLVAASPPKPMPKRTTITCVQGKRIKLVTAIKPNCPIGWRKRS